MNMDTQHYLAAVGTGGTFFLNEVNTILALVCGLLTLTHVSIALYKQNKKDKPPKKDNPKRPFL